MKYAPKPWKEWGACAECYRTAICGTSSITSLTNTGCTVKMLMIARVDHSVSPFALQCLSYRDRFDPSFRVLHGKGFGTAVG